KLKNKTRLATAVSAKRGFSLNPNFLFDCHVKRIHEYKRQLLSLLHVIVLYNRLKDGNRTGVPRNVVFAGKAAPGYWMAKQVIHLINAVANVINRDKAIDDCLKVVFLPNYGVSLATI